MWQVFQKVSDGYELWEQEVQGEIFATEDQAEARVAELDGRSPTLSGDYHFAREVD